MAEQRRARLVGRQTCVVHGTPTTWQRPHDLGSGRADRLGRVARRRPDLDLVLPHNAAGLDDGAHDIAAQASAAWEAAVCWDDDYAVTRLAKFELYEQRQRIERPHECRTDDRASFIHQKWAAPKASHPGLGPGLV